MQEYTHECRRRVWFKPGGAPFRQRSPEELAYLVARGLAVEYRHEDGWREAWPVTVCPGRGHCHRADMVEKELELLEREGVCPGQRAAEILAGLPDDELEELAAWEAAWAERWYYDEAEWMERVGPRASKYEQEAAAACAWRRRYDELREM